MIDTRDIPLDWFHADAVLSEDGKFRYTLDRKWDGQTWSLPIVMLNPSTADASIDDPTIKRCMNIAKRGGWGGIHVMNLFAYRTAYPYMLEREGYPEGPNNDKYIENTMDICREGGLAVWVAWGNNAPRARVEKFLRQAEGVDLLAWKQNVAIKGMSMPAHPLYAPGAAKLMEYKPIMV